MTIVTTTITPQFAVAYTALGQNAHNAPTLNVRGMPTAVKMIHEVFYEQMPAHMAKYGPKE